MSGERIVVTGLGVVTANGLNREAFWQALVAGMCAISDVAAFDTEDFISRRGGEIHDFTPSEDIRHFGRAKQFAITAAREALAQAGIQLAPDNPNIGIAMGTTMGESKELERVSDALAADAWQDELSAVLNAYLPQRISQDIARFFRFGGPCSMLPNACAAGNFAIGQSIDILRAGHAGVMLAGGTDAFSRYAYSGFSRLGAISPEVPRPFSIERLGMIPGEGAGVLVLETAEHARARGARVLATIAGYGESCDAYHITQPAAEGVAMAMQNAMKDAGIEAEAISFVSVHGTGTPANDATESKALGMVFGGDIPPVTAVKSMLGHSMGAASAIECVATILALQNQFIPPTVNYLGPDPECPVDCVPNQGREARLTYALKSASAFGGNNAALVFKQES